MNKQCDVLDTITIYFANGFEQSFTNKDGMIFLLTENGEVKCFDPFGEKQLTQIQDLQEY